VSHFARLAIIAETVVLAAAASGAQPACAQTPTERREAAVLEARSGHRDEAIATLNAMLAAGQDDGLVAMDLTALLQQAGRSADAVAVFEKAAVAQPPDYALLAATRAYRDLHRWPRAEALARQGLARFPDQTEWPLLLALVLADDGKANEALDILNRSEAQRAPPLERMLAQGYAWRRAGDPFRALSAYTDALRLAPANDEAREAAAELLRDQGGPFGAAALAGTSAPYDADEAAAMVRWGVDARPPEPERRFEGTDAAIARIDGLLAASPPPSDDVRRRLRLDRMVALRDRVRMREVVSEGDALRKDAPLPPYADEAYADALLYLRHPKQARAAYRRVLAAGPGRVSDDTLLNARYGVFYASVELEDFKTAYATIDALVRDLPIWRTYHNDPTRQSNPDRAFAEITQANSRFYGNQLAKAWDEIVRISDAAPANPSARMSRYAIARARGWPRLAQAEGQIAISLEPDSLDAKTARIEMALAEYRFTDARRMVRDLQAEYPESLRVRILARDIDAAMGWVFEAEARPSDSEGGGANASNQALTLYARLTGPPIADHWRVYAVGDYANANPPEGFVDRTRISAGGEWRVAYMTATAYVSDNQGTLDKAGGGATFDWLATDHVRLAISGELYTWDTPLRALLHGITADEIAARGVYRWDESHSLSASVAYLPFTDGNQRISGGVVYTQKLVNEPHFDLTGSAEVYASGNDRPQAPYYNPEHDLTADVGLLAEHTIWRRYEDSLTQELTVNAGSYSEAHFATDWIWTVGYRHRWRFDPRLEFSYGVEVRRRVYDGSPETTVAGVVALRRVF
jgi:biofilm PGA synthesis protein PgaA